MVFFHPTKKWINWLILYANNRIIVDLGCGEGELLKQLFGAGYNQWVGIDIYLRESLIEYFKDKDVHLWCLDTTLTSSLLSLDKCLFLFCRPCHGCFVEWTLENLPEVAKVLYVGKPGNLHIDIPPQYSAVEIDCPILYEEKVYEIMR